MEKFSVKKPFTVLVAVIAVIALGIVSYLNMTPDLLPNMDFPYVVIVTTYPGASPEKVEQEVTKPMEQAMATLEHIKEITSNSSENYSMLILEFEESVNLDTVGVDIQQNVSTLSASWDSMVSAPYVLKINPSMLPVMVAAVSMEGKDTIGLTQMLDEGLMNKLEGVPGVARISTTGTVTQQMHVVLDQKKIDAVNKKVQDAINGKMDDALKELKDTKKDLEAAKKQMEDAKGQLEIGKQELQQQTAAGEAQINTQLAQLKEAKAQLEPILTALKGLQTGLKTLTEQVEESKAQLQILKNLQTRIGEVDARQAALDAQIAAIQASGKPQQEIDSEIAALKASPEYLLLEADKATLEAELAANNVNRENLAQRIELTESALQRLDASVRAMEEMLVEQGIDPELLDKTVAEQEGNMAQINEGITMLEDAKVQLSAAKMEGLLQLAGAATELSVNGAMVQNGLTQLESGIDTLEDTREKTLESADLNKILTMEMISSILTAQNFAMPAGTITQDGVSYMVSVGENLTEENQVSDLLLVDMGMDDVEPIYLKDVAMVMVTDNADETYGRLNGLDSVILSFEKQSTYATAETSDNLLKRFESLEKEYPGLKFVPLMNQGDYIYMIVESIISSLLLGALFAILVLWLFLKDLRPTFITLCSIPISVVFAVVLMYFTGVTINMISLCGLAVAVGMLVDNSVVVIENIYRLRAKGATAIQAAIHGAKQVAGAVTASTLTTVCVFVPIVFVEGLTRQLFTDLALTMTYSLLASLIVSLTLVPAMAGSMLKKEKPAKPGLLDKLIAAYGKAAHWALGHKVIVLALSAALLIGSAVWSLSRGFIFMPTMDMPNITVNVSMPENATMEEAAAMADEVMERICSLEGIETVGAMMGGGTGLMGGGGGESYDVTMYVILSDQGASGAAMAKRIEALCADMECEVGGSSAMMDMSMLTGGSGISLRIFGDDLQLLQAGAQKAADALATVEGVTDVDNGLGEQVPALHVNVDRNKAMSQGITVAQIYMELAAALQNSTTVTTLQLQGTSTSLIVERPEEGVMTRQKLEEYPFSITTQTGETKEFKLSDVATVEEVMSLASINRLAQRRYLTVSASLAEGENVTLVTAKAQQVIKNTDLGQGVSYAFSGENETIMEAMEQLALMLLLGVLFVYLVMVAQFQSLKSPFIVMFTIPLAFTGGFMGLLLCGMEVSVIAMIGFVMLTGIIVNNGIVLVDYINQLRAEGMERRQAIVEAGMTRMRPILMTTITTILGLINMATSDAVGTAMMQPVAVVSIGGLTYATLMTLFVVPCIYDLMNKKDMKIISDADMDLQGIE